VPVGRGSYASVVRVHTTGTTLYVALAHFIAPAGTRVFAVLAGGPLLWGFSPWGYCHESRAPHWGCITGSVPAASPGKVWVSSPATVAHTQPNEQ